MPRASTRKMPRDERSKPKAPRPAGTLFRPSRIRHKSDGQRAMLDAIDACDMTLASGPAGCGKTYLAVAKASEMLANGTVSGIVLLRPTIGVGPTMGYLKGDMIDKVSPYLRPLLEELRNFHTAAELEELTGSGTIELTSLEYARGRTFKNRVVILDESQNATFDDFRVFLTRLGEGSKYIITGDLSRHADGTLKQSDLHPESQGAFEHFAAALAQLPGVAHVELKAVDIVRHPLVRLMVERGIV